MDTWGVSNTKILIDCSLKFSYSWALYAFICLSAAVPQALEGVGNWASGVPAWLHEDWTRLVTIILIHFAGSSKSVSVAPRSPAHLKPFHNCTLCKTEGHREAEICPESHIPKVHFTTLPDISRRTGVTS